MPVASQIIKPHRSIAQIVEEADCGVPSVGFTSIQIQRSFDNGTVCPVSQDELEILLGIKDLLGTDQLFRHAGAGSFSDRSDSLFFCQIFRLSLNDVIADL